MQVVTFDGPPFASGTPHYGHALVSIMKDTLGRFKTMQWYRVERIRWRDCHGLPVEKYVEKQLWLDGKKDIEEKLWIEKFVEACRWTVRNVNSEWKTFVDQIGRWADMDNAYFTMDLDYMESVMWVFSKLYDKNLVYRWFSVQWYCPSCATALSNSEVNEWYKDRQDPTVTVKFALYNDQNIQQKQYEQTTDGAIDVVTCIIKRDDTYLLAYHTKWQKYVFPGGKVEVWQSIQDAVKKELQEELGVQTTEIKQVGTCKNTLKWWLRNIHQVQVEITGEPKNMEPEKCTHLVRAQIVPWDNELWIAIKIDSTIIDDANEIRQQFTDLYIYHTGICQQTDKEASINMLAWTTTPWTLPSNMFLAVGPTIQYATVWDKNKKEYYILAQELLTSYYKSSDEYVIINTNAGEDLVGLSYKPLRDFYAKSKKITSTYKSLVHKVLPGTFVTTDSGTGIVHIAPAFWQDDFDVVKTVLPKDDADNWLFLPVDEYAEFTADVPNWKGVRCYDANKDIIQDLKQNNKIVAQNTLNHSYPHCRRCETPLIYKAMTSRFIKEQNIAQSTIPSLDNISFTPNGIKNRFRDVLKSAPDWNVSRNRYRGAPLPIWQSNKNPDERIIIKNLDDLYVHSKTGSANITKNIFLVHADADKNNNISKKWEKQADIVAKKLEEILWSNADIQIIISPEKLTRQTVYPYINKAYSKKELQEMQTKLTAIHKNYQSLVQDKKIQNYVKDKKNTKYFSLADGLAIDFRLAQEYNGQEAIQEINERYKTKTIVIVSDEETIYTIRKKYRQFSDAQKEKYTMNAATLATHYRDNTRNTEVDLHKPYVDNYRFEYKDTKYTRVPEVLDCWFESGAMPYGQVNYTGQKGASIHYPADFIIEWLDQTRWWFRTLHVLGQGIMKKNAFDNVIINWLILAEDGKKMSKKLKNYPEPSYLLEKYGPDALRMYLLTSPAVRAEPVRLWESMVEQMYKGFSAPLLNAYNFFTTYAKIDWFKTQNNTAYFIHESCDLDQSNTNKIMRMDIDHIIQINSNKKLATQVQNLMKTIYNKKVSVHIIDPKGADRYNTLHKTYANQNILIIGSNDQYKTLRGKLYGINNGNASHDIVPLPDYIVTNDLDRWILAALHQMIHETESQINSYMLDTASKEITWFIDKLTNRYIRRSRRRFWATGMDADKTSAYNTLFTVLKQVLHLSAPFAPFITEYIRQQIQTFIVQEKTKEKDNSIHLNYIPLSSPQYIDKQFLEEIELVRRIISLGLSVRSKNNIKIKQPLASLNIRIE